VAILLMSKDKYYKQLTEAGLFQGFETDEVSSMINCLKPRFADFEKGQAVALHGNDFTGVGIVVCGKVKIQKETISGKMILLDELGPCEMFGAGLSISKITKMPVSIWAAVETAVLFFDLNRLIFTCSSECTFHKRLIRNMFVVMSSKIVEKTKKITILKNATTRDKLMAFFEIQMEEANSRQFTITLNRNELADYIGSNRSAMSRELHNMRNEGIIEFNGNHFYILK
jgi:CRP-like cAMP-binding protein